MKVTSHLTCRYTSLCYFFRFRIDPALGLPANFPRAFVNHSWSREY
jgi:hypothetical protein